MTNPMGLMKPKTLQLNELNYPQIAQLKYDGVRLLTLVRGDKPTFWTYNGKQIPLPRLKSQLQESGIEQTMSDCEIIICGGTVKDRPSVSGMINSARCGGSINESILQCATFDTMPITQYDAKYCPTNYRNRYNNVQELTRRVGPYLATARNIMVNSVVEAQTLVEQIWADDLEGLILKRWEHLYSFKRDKAWARIVNVKKADLLCVDTTRGTKKYTDMIGALVLEGIAEGKNIKVKAGTGFKDIDRAMPPDWYINHTIEVKYKHVIQDSVTKQWSLYGCRYVCRRFDK